MQVDKHRWQDYCTFSSEGNPRPEPLQIQGRKRAQPAGETPVFIRGHNRKCSNNILLPCLAGQREERGGEGERGGKRGREGKGGRRGSGKMNF